MVIYIMPKGKNNENWRKKQKTDALSRGRMLPEANGYADTGF